VRLQNRRVLGSTVLALGAALVLAGCGAGQLTQTSSQEPAVNGAYAQAKALFIRNAALQYPPNNQAYAAGSSGALSLTIVNTGGTDDELVSVTSDAAASAEIQGSKLIVAMNSLVVALPEQTGATGGDSASVTSSPTTSPTTTSSSPATTSSGSTSSTSTSSTSTSSTSSTTTPPPAPTTSAAPVEVGKATIVLKDFNRPVWPGQTVKVTFVFRDSGPVTFDLPIAAPAKPRGDVHTEAAEATKKTGH
jgi:copper(I)-binding protein